MAEFPQQADVVIVGLGGIVGASIAHHLIELGWRNIVGLDKSAVPTDIGSTSHASDFCYTTGADKFTTYTTQYSQKFFESRGNYIRCGGLEVARHDDDARMMELQRKIGQGKAFGSRVSLISPAEAKAKFPLLEESMIQGAMWDPDAGLVVPRSQKVAGDLVDEAVASGHLTVFAHTPALEIAVKAGRVQGVHTRRGFIKTERVVVSAGIWGPLVAEQVDIKLPLMPLEHPLLFFGPYDALTNSGQEIVYPLFRDQGNSSYVRDTGDPTTTEGGRIEWGYYETEQPRLVHARDIAAPETARMSPSMRDLSLDQVLSAYERAIEMTPILGELGWEERHSFNGLLSVTSDGGSLIGEAPEVAGLWFAEAVWVKDGPGVGKVVADWMTEGRPELDPHRVDIARFYPGQKADAITQSRCYEIAQKVYTPAVHPREPFATGRQLFVSPFFEREVALGGYFMEVAGWERAHGYSANEASLLSKYQDQVPLRAHEWDSRHFWPVSNAEHLELSESVGMINLSHFAIYDISGPDAEALLEYLSVARIGGGTPIGKGVYTHFLDDQGGIRADLTIVRLAVDAFRVVCGGDTGHRDLVWIQQMAKNRGANISLLDRTHELATLGLWGPKARSVLSRLVSDPEALTNENFGFAFAKTIEVAGISVWAFRISYVGEQGWELYIDFADGLALWDALFEQQVCPIGIETYANSRRLEKSLRLQNADLETDVDLYEAGLARAVVKKADFMGKTAYLQQRSVESPSARLCTLSMLSNTDCEGVHRYPIGEWPILDEATGEVLVDSEGRRSYTTSLAYGPSLGKNLMLSYIPADLAEVGATFLLEYFCEQYPVRIEAVGAVPLLDPDNERAKS